MNSLHDISPFWMNRVIYGFNNKNNNINLNLTYLNKDHKEKEMENQQQDNITNKHKNIYKFWEFFLFSLQICYFYTLGFNFRQSFLVILISAMIYILGNYCIISKCFV